MANENLIEDFILESTELINQAELDVLELENNSGDRELVNNLFRAFHTIKGSAGFMGFNNLQSLLHNLEAMLSSIRNGSLSVDSMKIDILLEGIDIVNSMFDSIVESGHDEHNIEGIETEIKFILSEEDMLKDSPITLRQSESERISKEMSQDDELEALVKANLNKLNTSRAIHDSIPEKKEVEKKSPQQPTDDDVEALIQANLNKLKKSRTNSTPTTTPETPIDKKKAEESLTPLDLIKSEEKKVDNKPISINKLIEENLNRLKDAKKDSAKPLEVIDFKNIKEENKDKETPSDGDKKDKTANLLRIDSDSVDELLNYNEELVIKKNKLINIISNLSSVKDLNDTSLLSFSSIVDEMAEVTRTMQDRILEMRRIPINKVLSKYPFFVRKVARELKKKITIEINGGDTKFDRNIVDNLSSPILHLIRNSCDHGVEKPEEREKYNKPETGKIVIDIEERDSYAVISIRDDGAGINPEVMREIAFKKGFITEEERLNMSDEDAIDCIFIPGFSSKETANNMSGRGVGMDAVKEGIEKLNGSIRVESYYSTREGSLFEINIPLSLRVVNAVIFDLYGPKFAFPISSISKIMYLSLKDPRLSVIEGIYTIYLDGEVVPLYRVAPIFNIKLHDITHFWGIVCEVDGKNIMFPFIDLIKTEEVVVKSFDKFLKNVTCFLGVTITSDGTLVPVIDVLATKRYVDEHREIRQDGDYDAVLGKADSGILTEDNSLFNEISTLLGSKMEFVRYKTEGEVNYDSKHKLTYMIVDYDIDKGNGINIAKHIKRNTLHIKVALAVDRTRLSDSDRNYLERTIQERNIDYIINKPLSIEEVHRISFTAVNS